MSDLLKIGTSGLKAYQLSLTTTGNNISNANVEGYTRQDAILSTNPTQFTGAGYMGSGVGVDGIRRIADDFLTNQIRLDSSAMNQVDAYLNNISQMDSLLADASTGLSEGFQKFFASVQSGAEDPASIASRQLVLTESQSLVERFQSLYTRFADQNTILTSQMDAMAGEINTIASAIADLNVSIPQSLGRGAGSQPNDLLDKRDQLLKDLSQYVSVNVVEQNSGLINVFIGNGQPLVTGVETNKLVVKPGSLDPTRAEVGFQVRDSYQDISKQINGGQLGGILKFRSEVLDSAFNEVGRLAVVLADTVNRQNQLGVDLEGHIGGPIFTDVNDEQLQLQRVIYAPDLAFPADRVVKVEIQDVTALQASDYEFSFSGPSDYNYQILRKSDNVTVAQGVVPGVYPVTYEVDGLSITLESGSFQLGDKFGIQPMRHAAEAIEKVMVRSQELAFAYPIVGSQNIGNLGTGAVSAGEMLPTDDANGISLLSTFAIQGELNPPVLIRFTSPTTYDILDNSNPAAPGDMSPLMRGLRFVPNMTNQVFGTNPNQVSVASEGPSVASAALGSLNGHPAETINLISTDAETGLPLSQSVSLLANESARSSAVRLSQLTGVNGSADTQVRMTINDAVGSTMGVSLNGIDLSDPALGSVPDPLTADFIRDRINDNAILDGQGIIATSDGINLTVRSVHGDDLRFGVVSAGADSLDFNSINGRAPTGTTSVTPGNTATVGGIVMVNLENGGVLTTDVGGGGRFASPPTQGVPTYFGYQVELSGSPQSSDEFTVNFNADGTSDNRNALALAGLQLRGFLDNGGLSYQDTYGQFVEFIGAATSQARGNFDAAEIILRQSESNRESFAGVNLDEEAARLIQFEHAYNAAAQVINTARQTFDALLAAVR